MPLTNAGRDHWANTTIGNSVTAFNNANAYLGVGTNNTAFAATQTDLLGTKARKAMEPTYPILSGGGGTPPVLTFRSLFGTADANFAWEEWGTFNAASAGTMLNRKVESLGTKTNLQSYQLTVALTVQAS